MSGAPARAAGEMLGADLDDGAEKARGLDQQNDDHHQEDDGARRLGIEDLGQSFDHAERKPATMAPKRIEAADHHDGEDDAEDVRAHHRAHLEDRRHHHAGEAGERHAEP